MSGYSAFAAYYDSLTANIDYKKRAEYFNEIIKKFKSTAGNILLDLACGTGSISEAMAVLGYDVIGVDNSDEMLNIALDKKFDSGLNIQYLRQDMRKLNMYGSIDVTLCALDSINHLPSLDDVRKVFRNVALFSEPDGLFVFDVNTVYKHRNILAGNTFTYETDQVYCIWENTLIPETDEVEMHLEFLSWKKTDCTAAVPIILPKKHTAKPILKRFLPKQVLSCSENTATILFRLLSAILSALSMLRAANKAVRSFERIE